MTRFRVVDNSRFSSRIAAASPTGRPGAGPSRVVATDVLRRAGILAASEGIRDAVTAADVQDILESILGGSEGAPSHDGPVLGGYTTPSWHGSTDSRFDVDMTGDAGPETSIPGVDPYDPWDLYPGSDGTPGRAGRQGVGVSRLDLLASGLTPYGSAREDYIAWSLWRAEADYGPLSESLRENLEHAAGERFDNYYDKTGLYRSWLDDREGARISPRPQYPAEPFNHIPGATPVPPNAAAYHAPTTQRLEKPEKPVKDIDPGATRGAVAIRLIPRGLRGNWMPAPRRNPTQVDPSRDPDRTGSGRPGPRLSIPLAGEPVIGGRDLAARARLRRKIIEFRRRTIG